MLRFSTAGESHGEALIAMVQGLPAGIAIDPAYIDHELWRRQQGFGRGGRMRIETDKAHILTGVHHGITIGSPVAMHIPNADWKNWSEKLPVETGDPEKHQPVKSPRPGHADLAGALKYNFPDARYVLERASARESAARVAAGALAKLLLKPLGIEVSSHVIRVGTAVLDPAVLDAPDLWQKVAALRDQTEVLLSCVDPASEQLMKSQVDVALRTGDTVGGIFEVIAHGVPPGIGTYANWDERLDGQLAGAVMSLQAVKAVEIGRGVTAAEAMGSTVHDAIGYRSESNIQINDETFAQSGEEAFTRFTREHNNAGGIEGGVSNGEDVVIRGYLKPISTLRRPLASVSFAEREPVKAAYERSDVCVVPAAGVASEAMVALTIAKLVLEKFGGDSLLELRRNFDGYREQIKNF